MLSSSTRIVSPPKNLVCYRTWPRPATGCRCHPHFLRPADASSLGTSGMSESIICGSYGLRIQTARRPRCSSRFFEDLEPHQLSAVQNLCGLGGSEPLNVWLLDLVDDIVAFASFASQVVPPHTFCKLKLSNRRQHDGERAATAGASEIYRSGVVRTLDASVVCCSNSTATNKAFTIRLSSRRELEQALARSRLESSSLRSRLLDRSKDPAGPLRLHIEDSEIESSQRKTPKLEWCIALSIRIRLKKNKNRSKIDAMTKEKRRRHKAR